MTASGRGPADDPRARTTTESWLRLLPLLGGVVVLSLWAADVLPVLPAIAAIGLLALVHLAGGIVRARRDMDRRVREVVEARSEAPSEKPGEDAERDASGRVDLDPAQTDPSGKELQRFGE